MIMDPIWILCISAVLAFYIVNRNIQRLEDRVEELEEKTGYIERNEDYDL
jgi:hypothetical protein